MREKRGHLVGHLPPGHRVTRRGCQEVVQDPREISAVAQWIKPRDGHAEARAARKGDETLALHVMVLEIRIKGHGEGVREASMAKV